MKTKKVGSTGRFGSRYGKKIRTRVISIEQQQRKRHQCPYCLRITVHRMAAGLFACTKCKSTFTGRSYFP